MTKSYPRNPRKSHLKNFKMQTLTRLYMYALLIYIHTDKVIFSDSLQFKHNYNTRNETIYRLAKHRLTLFGKKSIVCWFENV